MFLTLVPTLTTDDDPLIFRSLMTVTESPSLSKEGEEGSGLHSTASSISPFICRRHNIGSLRELFFVNQIRNSGTIHPQLIDSSVELSGRGDFVVMGQYTFKIGGKGKGFKQISGIENSYIVSDDIEVGFKNKLPLWIFGFVLICCYPLCLGTGRFQGSFTEEFMVMTKRRSTRSCAKPSGGGSNRAVRSGQQAVTSRHCKQGVFGPFVLRVDKDLHREVAIRASLNSYCQKILKKTVGQS